MSTAPACEICDEYQATLFVNFGFDDDATSKFLICDKCADEVQPEDAEVLILAD
jgi:protein-arginine kinase activator protein McsA